MKRSEINAAIDYAVAFFRRRRFPLPRFAYWTPEEWRTRGPEYQEVRDTRIGWDVTDFGSGDFAHTGRTIFVLRNGSVAMPLQYPKPYVHKAMCLPESQKSPIHYHRSTMEDVFNQGGGIICIALWKASLDDSLSKEALEISVDGCRHRVSGGTTVLLEPGHSVCIVPRTYHQVWAKERRGTALSIGVSSVCDERKDIAWLQEPERLPQIDEDEPARYVLCGEYPPPSEGT